MNLPGIQCRCSCGNAWNVAFVPWSFNTADAFKCKACRRWAKQTQLFLNDQDAPPLSESSTMTTNSECTAAFILRGTDPSDCPYIRREFIWPSCDSPAHRKYIETEFRKRATNLNARGYKLTVHFQELHDGTWKDTEQS